VSTSLHSVVVSFRCSLCYRSSQLKLLFCSIHVVRLTFLLAAHHCFQCVFALVDTPLSCSAVIVVLPVSALSHVVSATVAFRHSRSLVVQPTLVPRAAVTLLLSINTTQCCFIDSPSLCPLLPLLSLPLSLSKM
jgi:hypothetical protein